jgi:hypothetical protein
MHFSPNDFDGFMYGQDGIEQCTAEQCTAMGGCFERFIRNIAKAA